MHKTRLIVGAGCLSATFFLTACGGSSGSSPAGANAISGTVAVGVPMTDATLRVVDATGAVVADGVIVAADGTYPDTALTGPAPYRLEVCGYSGPNYTCLHSFADGPGTVNVTPLTHAAVLLAAGPVDGSVMDGAIGALDANSVQGAQELLQQGLADVLSNAGLAPDLDFISGELVAGSRIGYDFLLDSVGVTTGVDTQPFVQITPRVGSGNLYLESGAAAVGEINAAVTGGLSLPALDTLFQNLSGAIASANACSDPVTGIRGQLAADARLNTEAEPVIGAEAVALALCDMFAGNEEEPPLFGSRLLSPNLGRCDLSGPLPRCRVSFVLQGETGTIQPVSDGFGVVLENGAWKFLGDADAVSIHASARAQRSQRLADDVLPDSYARALAFDIPALPGVECAQVLQPSAGGGPVTVAWFKRHATEQERLSLWAIDAFSNIRSLDPAVGATRSTDDTWVALPQGADGDAVIRNFYRGGRTVTVRLFGDSACTTPLPVEGQSEFQVDVEGVPPVWSALTGLPWPELTDTASLALQTLTVSAGEASTYLAAWAFPNGTLGIDGASFCTSGSCADGTPERLGQADFAPGATSVVLSLQATEMPLSADHYKQLSLYGRTGDGVGMQSNIVSCPLVPAGEFCQ